MRAIIRTLPHGVRRHQIGVGMIVLCLLLLTPRAALADPPGGRGPETLPQGGMNTTSSSTANEAPSWDGVRMLPAPAMPSYTPPSTPRFQDGGDGSGGALAWLQRNLNPGNWILDAGMGIFAGITKMFGGLMQKAVLSLNGTTSVIPSGCNNAVTNFVFCTPGELTYDHPGVQTVWAILNGVASGLVTLLFTVRMGRIVVEGPKSLSTEGKSLVLAFVFSIGFIQASREICKLIIEFFNSLSSMLMVGGALSIPMEDVGDLNIGSNIMFLIVWVMILLLTIRGLFRLVHIILLLAVAPLAGVMLMDRSTSSRFGAWFSKLIEHLFAQINLVIIFVVMGSILAPYQNRDAGDAFVGYLLAAVVMGVALSGQSVVGIASGAMGGGYLQSMLTLKGMKLAGSGVRAVSDSAFSRVGAVAGRAGEMVNAARGGINPQMVAAMSGGAAGVSGDPAHSAAAQRQKQPGSRGDLGSRSSSSPRAGISTKEQQRLDTAQAALKVARRTGDTRLRDRAQRQIAGITQKSLRIESREIARAAGSARLAGFSEVAGQLDQQADRKKRQSKAAKRISTHGVPSEQRHLSPAVRLQRERHREALAEVAGEHDLLRTDLNTQIEADERRAQVLPSKIAMNRAVAEQRAARYESQGNPQRAALASRVAEQRDRRLREEQTVLHHRLAENRALGIELNPREGESVAQASRRAARVRAVDAFQWNVASPYVASGQVQDKPHHQGLDRPDSAPPRRAISEQQRAESEKLQARLQQLARQKPSQRPSLVMTQRRAQGRKMAAHTVEQSNQRLGRTDQESQASYRRMPRTTIDDLRDYRRKADRKQTINQIGQNNTDAITDKDAN